MKRPLCILLIALAAGVLLPGTGPAYECRVCHSKNPKMVAMHKALEGKNCFGCHRVGDKLMGRGKPKDLNSLLQRRSTEEHCLPCHGTRN